MRRRRAFACNGSLVYGAGLAQACTHVNDPGYDEHAFGVNVTICGEASDRFTDTDDATTVNTDVTHPIEILGRVDHASSTDSELHASLPVSPA